MTSETGAGSLETMIKNHTATLLFGHPAGNSLPTQLLKSLANELELLSDNKAVKTIILKSHGERAFCAGASFDELIDITSFEKGKAFFSGFANVINAMRKCTKLIIGRVQGKAVGGGVGLIAACDYALATTKASIKLSELSIGIGPFVIAPALERKMDVSALSQLSIAAHQWHTAQWAKEKGLYANTFDAITVLDREVQLLSEKLALYNTEALKTLKKRLWQGTEHWETALFKAAEVSGKLILSEAAKKALAEFKK